MRHKAHIKDKIPPPPGTGECGLWAYYSRAEARRRNSDRPDVIGHRRPYLCRRCGLWHNGQLPQLVIDGVVTAAEWYGTDGNPPYGDILIGLTEWLVARGIYEIGFFRGPDGESWGMTARSAGHDHAVHQHRDPVDAAEAMNTLVQTAREQFLENAKRENL